jgi:hypothetical protein
MSPALSASHRRRSTLAAMGLIAVCFAGSTLLTPLYAFYEARFGFSPAVLTIVYAAYVIGNAGALLFLGRLSDRIGRRPIAFAALALATAATLLFLGARGTAWLFAGRVVSGFAVGLGSGTGTAWLVDLRPDARAHATLLAAEANMGGIGTGPLVAGILAAAAPMPLVLPFLVYGAALALVALAVARSGETVARRTPTADLFRPQLALPSGSRGAFVAPAVTGFVVFAFVGFYAALLPSILRHAMGIASPAVGGAILAELFAVAMAAMAATRRIASRTAMIAGLATIVPGLALLVAAQAAQSLPLLIVGTACGGVTLALGYRGSLEVVGAIAPPDHRSGVVSAYLLVGFAGNSIPVIGVGVATVAFGAVAASEIFAAVMLALTLAGLVAGLRYAPPR